MSKAAGVIISKAKCMHGRQLNAVDYHELLHKRTVAEIAGYLKNGTQYALALKDIRENNIHRGQLENILRRDIFRQTMSLYRYADAEQKDYYWLHMQQIEIDLILQCIRVLISGEIREAIADLPVFLRPYISFDLMRLGTVTTFDDLLNVLHKTMYYQVLLPYRVVKGNEREIAYTDCDIALTRYYYQHVFDVINYVLKGKAKKDVRTFFSVDVELSNLTRLYRFKRYFKVREDTIRDSLIPIYQHLSKQQIEQMLAQQTMKEFQQSLANSYYHLNITESEHVYIEWYMDRIHFKQARKNIYYSQNAPLIFSSYLYLQKQELENMINIIEGIRYQVDTDDIAKMLIY